MRPQLDEIEIIRRKLADIVAAYHGNLLHPEVLEVSQELDRYLNDYQCHR